MTTTRHLTYPSLVTAATLGLTTSLNSLAAGGIVAGSAYDNSSGLYLNADFYFTIPVQGSARAAGGIVEAYILPSVDGTNYGDTVLDCLQGCERGWFGLDAATTARSGSYINVPIPPGLFKVVFRNGTSQALNASGNKVDMRPHNLESV